MTRVETVTLPDLGEGLTESDLVEWTVAVGDTVELNQVIAEVETAKALVQLPSPHAGVVAELLVEPGTTVPVGAALMAITVTVDETAEHGADAGADAGPQQDAVPAPQDNADADAVADVASSEKRQPAEAASTTTAAPAEEAAAAAPARTSVLVGYGPLAETSARPRRRARSAGWVSAHAAVGEVSGLVRGTPHRGGPTSRPRANPPVRKLAHDLGVDLDLVEGSGENGMITREDVLRVVSSKSSKGATRSAGSTRGEVRPDARVPHLRRPAALAAVSVGSAESLPQPAQPSARASGDVRIPIAGVRKQTAAAMVASAFTAPHASVSLTVDVTPTVELVAELRADRALAGHRITILTLVAKAVTIALGRNPSLNARWDDDAGEIVHFGHVGLGIAAATPRGLIVPVVHDADRLRLPELADALAALTEAARAGTTTPADLAGGTITITNIGVFGVDTGTPILVPGQAAIVAIGAVRRQPWEHRDEIALRDVMTLSMSFDHRLVDGAEAARFLTDLGGILARPASVLAMV